MVMWREVAKKLQIFFTFLKYKSIIKLKIFTKYSKERYYGKNVLQEYEFNSEFKRLHKILKKY